MLNSVDIEKMAQHAAEAAALLKSLANQQRLLLLCSLLEGELSVGELNERVTLGQSALSQHLASLRKSALVATRREGQTIFYRLQGDHAIKVLATLKSIYCP